MSITVRTHTLAHGMDYQGPDDFNVSHEFPDGVFYNMDAMAGRPVVHIYNANNGKLGTIIEPAAILTQGEAVTRTERGDSGRKAWE